jgi:hypothetical protein
MFRIRSMFAGACVIAAVSLPLLFAQGASAAVVPPGDFTCGVTNFTTPCNQTAHFTDLTQTAPPAPNATGCPAYFLTDFANITGTGQGIEHAIINNALDGWFTTTENGFVTVTFINPLTGGADAVLTGHLTEWFGGSFNKNNFVNHDTINFAGDQGVSFHAVDHMSQSAAGQVNQFDIASC